LAPRPEFSENGANDLPARRMQVHENTAWMPRAFMEKQMAVVELTKENFEQVVTSNATVIVDYWAPWCGPCRGFAPVFEMVAEKHPDVVFAKVNTDEEQEIAAHFQIRSIPTLMVFREQIIVFSQPGALPQGPFEQVVEKSKSLDMEMVRKQMAEQEAAAGTS
jgi:thioredoxin 1